MHARYIKTIHPSYLRWATRMSSARQRRAAQSSAVAWLRGAGRVPAGADARWLAGASFAAWRNASRRRRLLLVTAVRFLTRRHERAIQQCFRGIAAHAAESLSDPLAGSDKAVVSFVAACLMLLSFKEKKVHITLRMRREEKSLRSRIE